MEVDEASRDQMLEEKKKKRHSEKTKTDPFWHGADRWQDPQAERLEQALAKDRRSRRQGPSKESTSLKRDTEHPYSRKFSGPAEPFYLDRAGPKPVVKEAPRGRSAVGTATCPASSQPPMEHQAETSCKGAPPRGQGPACCNRPQRHRARPTGPPGEGRRPRVGLASLAKKICAMWWSSAPGSLGSGLVSLRQRHCKSLSSWA